MRRSRVAKTFVEANYPAITNNAAYLLPIPEQGELIRETTKTRSPYSNAARAALIQAGYADFCAKQEVVDDLVTA
jgi:hypothetical protein